MLPESFYNLRDVKGQCYGPVVYGGGGMLTLIRQDAFHRTGTEMKVQAQVKEMMMYTTKLLHSCTGIQH